MREFQGLHVVPKSETHERDSRGLEPYLALEPRPKSNERANGWRWYDFVVIGASYAGTYYGIKALVVWLGWTP